MSQTENQRHYNKRFEMRLTEEEMGMLDNQRGLVSRGAYVRYLIRNAHLLPPVPGFTTPRVIGTPGQVQLRIAGTEE